jgi:hypothetical protein
MAELPEREYGSEHRPTTALRQRGATISCLRLCLLCSSLLCCAPIFSARAVASADGVTADKDFVYLIQVQVRLVHVEKERERARAKARDREGRMRVHACVFVHCLSVLGRIFFRLLSACVCVCMRKRTRPGP